MNSDVLCFTAGGGKLLFSGVLGNREEIEEIFEVENLKSLLNFLQVVLMLDLLCVSTSCLSEGFVLCLCCL